MKTSINCRSDVFPIRHHRFVYTKHFTSTVFCMVNGCKVDNSWPEGLWRFYLLPAHSRPHCSLCTFCMWWWNIKGFLSLSLSLFVVCACRHCTNKFEWTFLYSGLLCERNVLWPIQKFNMPICWVIATPASASGMICNLFVRTRKWAILFREKRCSEIGLMWRS